MKARLAQLAKLVFVCMVIGIGVVELTATMPDTGTLVQPTEGVSEAAQALAQLPVKGRAPKTGYSRSMFSSGWGTRENCDLRNYILERDMTDTTHVGTSCKVHTGTLADPYTATIIHFVRGTETSDAVQIDHVVALSDAWQKGAQNSTASERYALANDPLNLLAVDGKANQNKGDSDAASWLPPNKAFRCDYVARQIAVKQRYDLWVTSAEYRAIATVLADCPEQTIPKNS